MAKMILSMDGLVLKEIELTKERMTIGRRPHNDVVIDNLAVSGEHAVVVTILNDSFLEDMGSTNGTMVNSQPIKKHFLQNNDVVELGKYKLKYVADTVASRAAADATRSLTGSTTGPTISRPTVGASQNGALTQSGGATQNPVNLNSSKGNSIFGSHVGEAAALGGVTLTGHTVGVGGASAGQAAIQILNGANAGKELVLSKPLTTLGRPGVQVAVITKRGSNYSITHVEGSTFPVVNGKTLGVEPYVFKDHDIIELSGTKMEFYFL
jgi:hypothetical protein